METTLKLNGQTAIVTGSSSGLGEAIALELASAGANVVVNYHSGDDEAEAVVKRIEERGGRAIAVGADVGEEADVKQMFAKCIAAFGYVDIPVNNSGIQRDKAFHEMSLDEWNQVINTNLTGQFLCAREAVNIFLKQGMRGVSKALGKIICISSVHDVIPWAGHVNYAASKGGVMMLMKSLAQELAPKKIRVNSISPGAIQTPINKEAWGTDEALNKLLELIPYGRIGQPEDVAKQALWLASDESDYVTGATHYIDGGMTLYPGFADNG
ncbi:SDR family oxidoreductase [Chitinophaga sedimenti]|uniref:SDR family oxidoreductase n=1 Tax=Chitinophaga sedimenti TaxID=2033606 RepID=UPI0020064E5D|nr:SDR family oxidoreductase [Chitinophaga sedimenti]MCK7556072.1 SDR family oxidoreductase [Chitinophaga sedimenti]